MPSRSRLIAGSRCLRSSDGVVDWLARCACARCRVWPAVISLAAYTIVLWAQTSGALAPIAALRETSIVFGALIGAVFLGERLGPRRAIAAAVVLAGVLLISVP